MPRLLHQLFARLQSPIGEGDGGGQITDAELAEHDITREEFNALPAGEQQALAAKTPDDTVAVTDEEAAAAKAAAQAATPAPTAAPVATPAPTAAPQATPAPTAAPVATPAPTAAPVATPAPTAPPAGTWKPAPPSDDEVDTIVRPQPMAPKDAADQIKTAKTEKNALWEKFSDGELTKEEYQAQVAPLEDKIETLGADVAADRAAQTIVNGQVAQRWTQMVKGTITELNTAGGVNLEAPEHKDTLAQLDAAVRRFGQAGPLMHPGKSALWYERWALDQAKQELATGKGWKIATQAPPQATQAPRAAPDLSTIPPTLRGAPPAGDPNITAGEFAHLDAMNMTDREKAVAMMTPEQQDRYLAL